MRQFRERARLSRAVIGLLAVLFTSLPDLRPHFGISFESSVSEGQRDQKARLALSVPISASEDKDEGFGDGPLGLRTTRRSSAESCGFTASSLCSLSLLRFSGAHFPTGPPQA